MRFPMVLGLTVWMIGSACNGPIGYGSAAQASSVWSKSVAQSVTGGCSVTIASPRRAPPQCPRATNLAGPTRPIPGPTGASSVASRGRSCVQPVVGEPYSWAGSERRNPAMCGTVNDTMPRSGA